MHLVIPAVREGKVCVCLSGIKKRRRIKSNGVGTKERGEER